MKILSAVQYSPSVTDPSGTNLSGTVPNVADPSGTDIFGVVQLSQILEIQICRYTFFGYMSFGYRYLKCTTVLLFIDLSVTDC
jgi:hypothetical protein